MSAENGQSLERGLVFQEAAENSNGPEAQAHVVKKTPKMVLVEELFAQPGESIADLLGRLYVDEDKSFKDISRELSANPGLRVSAESVIKWIKALHPKIPIKSAIERLQQDLQQEPHIRERRISAIRTFWKDPEKKRQAVAKIHTPKSDALRSQSHQTYAINHPEEQKAYLQSASETLRRNSISRRSNALSGDPKEVLTQLVSQGLKSEEIAQRAGVSPETIRNWLKEYGINRGQRRRNGVPSNVMEERRSMIQRSIDQGLFGYLSPQQQEVLRALYPQEGIPPTKSQIARQLHKTDTRIGQLDNRGLKKLERLLSSGTDGQPLRMS